MTSVSRSKKSNVPHEFRSIHFAVALVKYTVSECLKDNKVNYFRFKLSIKNEIHYPS